MASAAFLSNRPVSPALVSELAASDESCLDDDEITIYKYTMLSSKAKDDAVWAGELFGCTFRNVTDAHGCAELGKTSCMQDSLAYNLHFVVNHVTPSGTDTVEYWDDEMVNLHGDMEEWNSFMDYRMVFYKPSLEDLVQKVIDMDDQKFMLRASDPEDDGTVWYSLLLRSVSGKIFEVTSTQLNKKTLGESASGKKYLKSIGGTVKSWEAGSCPGCQKASSLYTSKELDSYYVAFNDASKEKNGGEGNDLLPIRNQIAVKSLAKATAWWTKFIPSAKMVAGDEDASDCKSSHFALEAYTAADLGSDFRVETRFVENSFGGKGSKELAAFIDYIETTHDTYTGPNKGWDAWFDRHLGLLFSKCKLDTYMSKFYKNDVSFNPHGRASTTEVTDSPTQHCWTEGVQGYGVEMQGAYDFSFRDCYTIFDWCTETTNGKDFCSSDVS